MLTIKRSEIIFIKNVSNACELKIMLSHSLLNTLLTLPLSIAKRKTDRGIECALTLLIIEYFYYNSLCSNFSFVNSSYNIVIIAKYFFQKRLWIATQENNVHTKDTYCKVSIFNNQSHFSLTAEAEAPTWFEILVKFYLVLFGEKYM